MSGCASKAAVTDGSVDLASTPPTVIESLQELARVLGPAAALRSWSKAAAATGHHGMYLRPSQIAEVAEQLMKANGLVRVAGRSLRTRCQAHLSRRVN